MPSVYEYHHVELDKVGKGKRVLKPPGGACSDIFGGAQSPSSENSSGSTTPTGRRSSDFGSNTKDRLFGGEATNVDIIGSPNRRASIDRMKSNIFTGSDQADSPKTNSAKKYGSVTPRRNPITGEFEETRQKTNGFTANHVNGNGTTNGHSVEEKLPAQPQNNGRIRRPPGGESSGIF